MSLKWAFLLALVYGASLVLTDESDNLDLDLPPVQSGFQIPGLDLLPINKSALPNPEEVERVLREKCEKNGGDEAFERAINARENLEKCVRGLVNFNELTARMEAAKPTGDLDEVFRDYCGKSPLIKECIMNFVNEASACLTEAEQQSRPLVQNVTEQLVGFICFKEGDRIALFIAESGPECLSDKKEAIVHCINSTLSKRLPSGSLNVIDFPKLLFGAEECRDVCSLQQCVVRELEKCKEPTPANIVQAMFDYVLKVTPCHHCKEDRLNAASTTGGTEKISVNLLSLALSTAVVFLMLH